MALAQGTDVQEGECLLALEELHGGDLACGPVRAMVTSAACTFHVPLIILQKMHEAAMLVGGMICCVLMMPCFHLFGRFDRMPAACCSAAMLVGVARRGVGARCSGSGCFVG